jgi:hypothetical protein
MSIPRTDSRRTPAMKTARNPTWRCTCPPCKSTRIRTARRPRRNRPNRIPRRLRSPAYNRSRHQRTPARQGIPRRIPSTRRSRRSSRRSPARTDRSSRRRCTSRSKSQSTCRGSNRGTSCRRIPRTHTRGRPAPRLEYNQSRIGTPPTCHSSPLADKARTTPHTRRPRTRCRSEGSTAPHGRPRPLRTGRNPPRRLRCRTRWCCTPGCSRTRTPWDIDRRGRRCHRSRTSMFRRASSNRTSGTCRMTVLRGWTHCCTSTISLRRNSPSSRSRGSPACRCR